MLLRATGTACGVTVKIVDFGIARIDTPIALQKLTRTGAFLGTPCYMAPEAVRDPRTACDRSDVYALGIILFQMLVGETPFSGESIGQLVMQHLSVEPPALADRLPSAPPQLCALVRRMLAKKPEQRPTMREIGHALRRLDQSRAASTERGQMLRVRGAGSRGRPFVQWAVASLLVGTAALGFHLNKRPPSKPTRVAVVPIATSIAYTPVHASTVQPAPKIELPPLVLHDSPRPVLIKLTGKPRAQTTPEKKPQVVSAKQPARDESAAGSCVSTLRNPFDGECAAAPVRIAGKISDAHPGARRYLMDAAQFRAHGDLRAALAKSRLAITDMPTTAWGFIGALGCELHDYAVAREAFRHIGAAQRDCLEDVCRAFGVQRNGENWHLDASLRRGVDSSSTELALQDARQSYNDHLWDRAIQQAEVALKGSHYAARSIIGRSACMKGDTQLARQSICRLDPQRQVDVQHVCRTNGIELALK